MIRIGHVLLTSSLFILATAPSASAAQVAVSFVHPEQYSDAGLDYHAGAKARGPVLRDIGHYLERLGERHLGPSQTLTIDVLDIDLAGQFEPWRPYAYNARTLRAITWPRIKLRYTLRDGDKAPLSAEETIADLDYQNRAAGRSGDPLRYEKAMLNDWFTKRFASP